MLIDMRPEEKQAQALALLDEFGLLGRLRELATANLPVEQARAALEDIKSTWKKEYRRLALELHPDRNPDPAAHERFKRLATANEHLEGLQIVPRRPPPRPVAFVTVYTSGGSAASTNTTYTNTASSVTWANWNGVDQTKKTG